MLVRGYCVVYHSWTPITRILTLSDEWFTDWFGTHSFCTAIKPSPLFLWIYQGAGVKIFSTCMLLLFDFKLWQKCRQIFNKKWKNNISFSIASYISDISFCWYKNLEIIFFYNWNQMKYFNSKSLSLSFPASFFKSCRLRAYIYCWNISSTICTILSPTSLM